MIFRLIYENATSCETRSIFYYPKVNNTIYNSYSNTPVEEIF